MPRNRHKPQQQIQDLAAQIDAELKRDAPILAERLRDELPVIDGVHVSEERYHEYLRQKWWATGKDGQTPWRVEEWQRVGDGFFWEHAHKAFGLVAPKPSKELLGLAPMAADAQGNVQDMAPPVTITPPSVN